MKEMNEQKYSRNMALSFLAGIALGAVIVLALLWALGYIPGREEGQAVEAGTDFAFSGTGAEGVGTKPSSENRETMQGPGEAEESALDITKESSGEPMPETTLESPEEEAWGKPQNPAAEPGYESASEPTDGGEKGEPGQNGNVAAPGAVSLDFQLNGSWSGEEGCYYQYAAVIENDSDQKITDWKIMVQNFERCRVDSYWCCEIEERDGLLVVTPADYNVEIWEDGKAEGIGLIILAEEEWKLTDASLEAETSGGGLNAVFGAGPDIEDDVETGQDASNPEETGQDASNPEETGQDAHNQGNRGPDILAGDLLGDHALAQDTPVGGHGRLRVESGSLVDQEGNPYQMHGVSTHGLAWFPEYVSRETFRTFRNEWDADVIRLAMYSDEYGGYSNGGDQEKLKELIDKGVEYASELGMYVIIDWHVLGEGDPNIHREDAIAFFDEISQKYAEYGNVIYEICNEPNGGVSWKDVKKYAQEVIPVIRANDPYGIILVGTPQWSQLIGDAAADPIEDYDNIMYTLHFYAATHKDELRGNLEQALKDGVPVFVSECSICDASGGGGVDGESALAWVDLMDRYDVSYVAWAVSNKNETAALISSGCSKLSDWSDNELSDTGRWFKEQFTK